MFGGVTLPSAADVMVALAMIVGAGTTVFKLSATWVAAGFAVWLPANAIADEMPVLVSLNGPTTAALITIAMQAGNIGLLLVPKVSARAMTTVSVITGFAAFGIMVAPGHLFVVACSAFLAGFAGATGSTVLWGQLGDEDVVSFSTGLSLACFVSGAAIMGQKAGNEPTFSANVYFGGMSILYAGLVGIARAALPTRTKQMESATHEDDTQVLINDVTDELELPLIDETPNPVPITTAAPTTFIAMGWLYACIQPTYVVALFSAAVRVPVCAHCVQCGGHARAAKANRCTTMGCGRGNVLHGGCLSYCYKHGMGARATLGLRNCRGPGDGPAGRCHHHCTTNGITTGPAQVRVRGASWLDLGRAFRIGCGLLYC